MTHVSSPGKLMISGEWAIMEPGNPCIVVAVNRRVHARLEEYSGININMKDFGISADAEFDGNKLVFKSKVTEEDFDKLVFIQASIETALKYIKEAGKKQKNFRIETWKEPDAYKEDEDRIGFGYFASAIVSVVAGIMKFHGFVINDQKGKELVFKLSVIAYYSTPGHGGSAYNIAASVYGNAIVYRRFDGEWFKPELNQIENRKSDIKTLVGKNWPGLYIKEISLPHDMQLCVAWTGSPSSTRSMVKQMTSFKKQNSMGYSMLMSQIRNTTDYLITYFRSGDRQNIIETLKKNQEYLKELGVKSGVETETPALRKLAWIAAKNGCAGKQSGAGRGNYGLAVCFDREAAEKVKNQWLASGITPLDLSIDKEGLKEEI